MSLADLGAVKLYVEVSGDGPPVVLVHEFAGSFKSWAPQVQALQSRFRTIVYNCRGYPPSTVPDDVRQYSQDHSIADLEGLLSSLELDRVALVGLSMGGSIALNFSLRHPERVTHLVIAATGSGAGEDAQDFARQFESVAARLEREGIAAVADAYLVGPTRLQLKRKRPQAWRKLYQEFCALSPRGLACTIRGAILPRPSVFALESQFRRLEVPTLIIAGDEDTPTLAPSRFMANAIPNAELAIFQLTGHTVNLEEPEQFNAAVETFLTVPNGERTLASES